MGRGRERLWVSQLARLVVLPAQVLARGRRCTDAPDSIRRTRAGPVVASGLSSILAALQSCVGLTNPKPTAKLPSKRHQKWSFKTQLLLKGGLESRCSISAVRFGPLPLSCFSGCCHPQPQHPSASASSQAGTRLC